jgi:hypothetical protein
MDGATSAYKGIPAEYEVQHRCGEGTFGQVFLCRSKTGQHVAIKTIKQEAGKHVRLCHFWVHEKPLELEALGL